MNKILLAAVLAILAFGTMANKCTVTNTPSQSGEQKKSDEQKPATPADKPAEKPAQ